MAGSRSTWTGSPAGGSTPARPGWSARRWPPNGASRPNRSRPGGTTSYASLAADVRDDGHDVLAAWTAAEGLDRADALRAAVDTLALVESLPPIAVLRPPPGTTGALTSRSAGTARSGSPMLDRVRALLAKAESTTFPAEAEALTGKAQELIARHSIDEALLAAGSERGDVPGGVRLSTDTPYAGAKALLVQEVAAANRCEAVWSDDLGFATVLGWPADLVAVELLYTSLLVQATAAMLRGRAERRSGSGRRTKVWDESFLNAFALRIGERLRTATEAATEAADQASAETAGAERLLPVLAARGEAVRERLDTLFPGVTRHRLSVRDAEGWSSGTSAADRASLDVGGGQAAPTGARPARSPLTRPAWDHHRRSYLRFSSVRRRERVVGSDPPVSRAPTGVRPEPEEHRREVHAADLEPARLHRGADRAGPHRPLRRGRRDHEGADRDRRAGRRPGAGQPVADVDGPAVDGSPEIVDGPFMESKEQFAGYLTVDCDSPQRAAEIAARWPDVRYGGAMEVRPVMDEAGTEM